MIDKDMRPLIRAHIASAFPAQHRVIEELTIGGSRADFAVISHEGWPCPYGTKGLLIPRLGLTLIEVKSDKDTFDRLPTQTADYCMMADRVILALTAKKALALKADARAFYEKGYYRLGVWEVGETLKVEADGYHMSPNLDVTAWLWMLWQQELVNIARAVDPTPRLNSKNCQWLRAYIAERLPAPAVKQAALAQLMVRDFNSQSPWGTRKSPAPLTPAPKSDTMPPEEQP